MDKIILLMIVGLLIIGAIALNDILNSPDIENTPATTERQTYSNPTLNNSTDNITETVDNPETPPSRVSQC
ncbi:MAG TPA: hypothetical protein PL168_10085 [Methanobacterium sp.]|jgi:hypothetical protein|nr:hypothetical protein [Methanobacterium sp.]HOI41067.1 hypothetical protein [Methanobacterium sp.]